MMNLSTTLKLSLITFLDLLAVGLIFPVLANHVKTTLGASHTVIGFLSSTYSIFQVVTGPIVGSWSDIHDRKKIFILLLTLSAICYFCLGLSTSIYTIFLFRLLLGTVKHSQCLIKAIIADHGEKEMFGKVTAVGGLGFVIGPAIGGHLMLMPNGFYYITSLTAVLFLFNVLIVISLPDPPKKQTVMSSVSYNVFRNLLDIDWKEHWKVFALKFCFIFSTTIFFVNQTLLIKDRYDLPSNHIGYLISGISLVMTLSSYFHKSFKYESTISFLLLAVSFALFYITTSIYSLFISLLLFSVSNGFIRVNTLKMLYKNESTLNKEGLLTGASDSVMAIARFSGPLTSGLIGDTFGEYSLLFYCVLVASVGVGVSFNVENKVYSNKKDVIVTKKKVQ